MKINEIKKKNIIYRTMGGTDSNERIGIGFMNKSGVTVDEKDFEFPEYALVYVIQGEGEYIDCKGNSYPLKSGSIFQRHPEKKHSTLINPNSNWQEFFINIGPELYKGLSAMRIIRKENYTYNIEPDKILIDKCLKIYQRLEECTEDELPDVSAQLISFLVSILKKCHYGESKDGMNKIIQKSCDYFSRNSDLRIDLKEYCAKHAVGYENFRKHFTLQIGISPGKFIIRRRLDKACEMLKTSSKSIGEVADYLGYSSSFDFSKQFKRFIGKSPKHYKMSIPI